MRRLPRALPLLALITSTAVAGEPERVVVRHRLYTSSGKLELSASAGLTPVDFLTDHKSLALGLGYNLAEQWALELEGGYALSRHTRVAQGAAARVVTTDPAKGQASVDDFSDLWQMTWNTTLVLRWTPIYGKINLAAELPVHFQAYLVAGGGAGRMVRDSLVYCVGAPTSRPAATCDPPSAGAGPNDLTPLHETALKPLAAFGGGLRFFVSQRVGVRVEVRDLAFPDSYRVGIDRAAVEQDPSARGSAPGHGRPAGSPGITHLVFARVGAILSF